MKIQYPRPLFLFVLITIISVLVPLSVAHAGGFFEFGEVNLPTTIDTDPINGWVQINLTQTYVNPVVIAGALTENNQLSLSVRVRNVTATTFEIGMQSPCESLGAAGGIVCPPAGGWLAETAFYVVMEEGTWVFPDGLEIEAGLFDTNTVRSAAVAGNGDTINLTHVFAGDPVVFHAVNTDNDPTWITTSVFQTGNNLNPPTGGTFDIALEGAEATNAHGVETLGWIASQPGVGNNATFAYEIGRTAGLDVDRHDDACTGIGAFTSFGVVPQVVVNQTSMNGANGSWARICGAGVQINQVSVHVDEDQSGDAERTGNPEYASWFAYDTGGFGALDFITATQTVTDDDGGNLLPGDFMTYQVILTNQQNDFAQADNANPEFVVPIPINTTFDSVVLATGGALTYNGALNQMEWNGVIPAGGVITLEYRVQVSVAASCAVIASQGTVFMDANTDTVNSITELSDDPTIADGVDADGDNLTADDDQTTIAVDCDADLVLTQTDTPDPITDGSLLSYQITVTNNGPGDATNVTLTDVLSPGVTFVFATPSQGTPCTGTTVVTCNLGTIVNGAVATVTIGITPNGTGTLVNSASVGSDLLDPDTTNNLNITELTTVTAPGSIGTGGTGSNTCVICGGSGYADSEFISKSVDLTLADVADSLTYTIDFTNPRNVNLRQVVIQDTLDSRLNDLEIISYQPSNAIVEIDGSTIVMQGFDLAPGQSGQLIVTGVISPSARPGQRITNQAVLFSPDASSHPTDVIVTYVNPVDLGAQRSRVIVSYVNPTDLFGPTATVETFVLPEQLPNTGQSPLGRWRSALLISLGTILLGMILRMLPRGLLSIRTRA